MKENDEDEVEVGGWVNRLFSCIALYFSNVSFLSLESGVTTTLSY